MTFKKWKIQCETLAVKLLGITDLFVEDDPYDLAETSIEAYESDYSPEDFLRESFPEDFSKIIDDDDDGEPVIWDNEDDIDEESEASEDGDFEPEEMELED